MGLDMNLFSLRFLSDLESEDKFISDTVQEMIHSAFKPRYILADAASWRKCNAIHNWFVQNCQDGVDKCQMVYVTRKKLETLLRTVNEVLAVPADGPRKLPTKVGPFFGDTAYDDGYAWQMTTTQEKLEKLMASPEWADDKCGFVYSSSW